MAVLVLTNGAEPMSVTNVLPRIPLSAGARQTNLTSQGLLKILRRTDSAIRDDGRWYVDPVMIAQIAVARRVLGIDRSKRASAEDAFSKASA
jgi:hypothetical protein